MKSREKHLFIYKVIRWANDGGGDDDDDDDDGVVKRRSMQRPKKCGVVPRNEKKNVVGSTYRGKKGRGRGVAVQLPTPTPLAIRTSSSVS